MMRGFSQEEIHTMRQYNGRIRANINSYFKDNSKEER